MKLSDLAPGNGAVKKRKRVGRGPGSGHGKRCCRGNKGQKARNKVNVWFEGGQMPLQRRLPKRGFTPLDKEKYAVVSLKAIAERFAEGEEVNPDTLVSKGLVRKKGARIKILASEAVSVPFKISAHAISSKAKEIVEGSGGSFGLLD